ncbi:hypothetical protein JZ751_014556 [Albula glossodonta]|uniref:Zinc finger MYND domain-containing protein 10 n=1 Tax=Albula glossodonta TaxID=121402 RepID=A0A8T2N3P6_9TELE|nr:hypothetical protein JZ751_014556 [Albula glossodonta]
METSCQQVLFPGETEGYVQSLETFPLKDIGSSRWFKQHEYIEKLNMQAILDATGGHDEFVKEQLVSLGKIPTLIHEMILVEAWKVKIFPILCQLQDFNPQSTFPLYMVIHHEATIINVLETIMYHRDSCEAAEDSVLDLVDYCHRKLTLLVGRSESGDSPLQDRHTLSVDVNSSSVQDLQKQSAALEFEISLKALSLVEHCPWSRISKGQLEKYMDGKWHSIPKEDRVKMTKLDGQVWIALLNLLLKPECQRKYDFNSFNKSQLLKLRAFLNEVLIDQLPNLGELQRFLSHLAVTDPAPPKKDLILEQIPEMWNNIMKENSGKWKAVAKYQVKQVFNPSESDLRQQAHRLAQTYNLDVIESLIPEKPKCGSCGSEATKRCSRCQGEWYCRRECQVKHWPKHKKACQLMVDATEKLQRDLNIKA